VHRNRFETAHQVQAANCAPTRQNTKTAQKTKAHSAAYRKAGKHSALHAYWCIHSGVRCVLTLYRRFVQKSHRETVGAPAPPTFCVFSKRSSLSLSRTLMLFFAIASLGCEIWAPFPNVTQPCTMRAKIAPRVHYDTYVRCCFLQDFVRGMGLK